MHATLATLAVAALSASAAPAAQSPLPSESLAVSLHSDTHCNILGGEYPHSLHAGRCYNATAGFRSLEIYAPPVTGGMLSVYPDECCPQGTGQGLSTEFRACQNAWSFVGKAIEYTREESRHGLTSGRQLSSTFSPSGAWVRF